MHKTSVYLTDEEIARLVNLAQREGTSQAEVIRRAVRGYDPGRNPGRDFSLIGSADGPGDSAADLTEEELLEGFGTSPLSWTQPRLSPAPIVGTI